MTKRLHVIYKTHLDIGFTDLASRVEEEYLTVFFPRALELAEKQPDKFIWTTGSWLIKFFLESPKVTPSDKERLIAAIEKGRIAWHGLPFTTHTELLDRPLLEAGIAISQKLDQTYGKTTIAAKMTDIPGHSISLVPVLAAQGIKYLHIGVNASSAVPDVPELFLWRATDGSEIVVQYAKDYGATFEAEGWEDGLYFAHSHDNMGPPKDEQEVLDLFAQLALDYPDAEIIPSDLNQFAEIVWAKRAELPVVEEEIGDSWIHGVGSDPQKISNYLRLLELRDQWVKRGELVVGSESYQGFSEQLLLVAEHTWGGNGNVYLPDYKNYQLADFKAARVKDRITFNHDRSTMDYGDLRALISTDIDWAEKADSRSYAYYEKSWEEQRNYVVEAIKCLPDSLQKEAFAYLKWEANARLVGQEIIPGKEYQFGQTFIKFGLNGSIISLKKEGKECVVAGKELFGLSYERYDFADYAQFLSKYSRLTRYTTSWATVDFAKPGIEAHQNIRHEVLRPAIEHSEVKELNSGIVAIRFDLAFTKEEEMLWGVPSEMQISYLLDVDKGTIEVEFDWANKQANRMPEAYWLEMSLAVNNPYHWQMTKINQSLSPYDIVAKGNRSMHALTKEGLTYHGADGDKSIQSFDAPLFSLGQKGLLLFDHEVEQLNRGIYVNLFNNVWGTNFAAWNEGNMNYRFRVRY
ncbi:hypothetical protein IGI37_000459 [Enterococcus sp. AZ194]|uniref:DUF5054 domain-containing protein n=1 Tax=Enterococcus sp. AZ194 TaxID=2774629 RepID=UPI003F257793